MDRGNNRTKYISNSWEGMLRWAVETNRWYVNAVYADICAGGARVDGWLCANVGLDVNDSMVGDVGVKSRTAGSTNIPLLDKVLEMELDTMCAGGANMQSAWAVVSANIGGGAPTRSPNSCSSTAFSGTLTAVRW